MTLRRPKPNQNWLQRPRGRRCLHSMLRRRVHSVLEPCRKSSALSSPSVLSSEERWPSDFCLLDTTEKFSHKPGFAFPAELVHFHLVEEWTVFSGPWHANIHRILRFLHDLTIFQRSCSPAPQARTNLQLHGKQFHFCLQVDGYVQQWFSEADPRLWY